MTAQLTGAPSRTVTWPQYTGPQRAGRPRTPVPSRWPLHMPGATLDYALDLSAWLAETAYGTAPADVIGGIAGAVARADGAASGTGDLSMLWLRAVPAGGVIVACLQGGLPAVDYVVALAVGTMAGRLLPVAVSIETTAIATPALVDAPPPGAPWPPAPADAPATATTLGGVIVPVGGGFAVDGSGNLTLSAAGLPTDPTGLPAGTLYNQNGLIAVVTLF